MNSQNVHPQLTPYNCTIILLDYQCLFASAVNSIDGKTLINNVVNLAKMTMTFNIPLVLTTIGAASLGGPLLLKLQELFPAQKSIDRTALSIWEDTRVLTAIGEKGRNKLVIAGLWTDFGVAVSVLQGLKAGYDVYIVVDACGDVSEKAHRIAIERMLQEGAVPVTWLQMFLTLHRGWAPQDLYKILLNIVKNHARAYGLGLQYEKTSWDEGQTKELKSMPTEAG
jgi:nicotinamidase-related amidase